MIKLKVDSKLYLMLGFLILILIPSQNVFALEKVKGQKFLLVHYTHPRLESVVPIQKHDLDASSSGILIGNQKHIKTAVKLTEKTLAESEDHTNKDFSYFLKIEFYDKEGNHDAIYLDKNRNFIFESLDGKDTKGRAPENLFNKLVEFCDPFTEIVDLDYLRERAVQPKKEFEAMIYSSKDSSEKKK